MKLTPLFDYDDADRFRSESYPEMTSISRVSDLYYDAVTSQAQLLPASKLFCR